MSDISPVRRPYKGSCHCGAVQYVAFLTLPHTPVSREHWPKDSGRAFHRFYRCNCTTCHKSGFFHMRLPWAPEDFLLLSPKDPFSDLGDYQCFDKELHWFFCKTCGVRSFIFAGEGENAVVDMDELGIKGKDGEGLGKKTIWRPKSEGWGDGRGWGKYLSVNGYTVDAEQEGFDLREMTETKVVEYIDCLELSGKEEGRRFNRPHESGAY